MGERIYVADKTTLDEVNGKSDEIKASLQSVKKDTDDIKNTVMSVSSGGIAPSNMRSFSVQPAEGKVKIKFLEPEDTIIDGQLICTWKGVKIVMKEGDYPESETDGTEILDCRTAGQYAKDAFEYGGLTNDTTYYFQAFPYSDYNIYNRNAANRKAVTPSECLIYGFKEYFGILDSESRIVPTDTNADFTPMRRNSDGTQDYGSWAGFPLLEANKPYMVNKDGTVDYSLLGTDYTKKADGETASDVSNASYAGAGAFSWLKKTYCKETYGTDDVGAYRHVQFAFDNSHDQTSDFEPYAFMWDENTELEGLWVPMFYMSDSGKTISGTQPIYGKTTDQERSILQGISERAVHFGGPVMNFLRDIAYLLTNSTDIQKHWGEGCMSAYNSNGSPTYGVKKNAVVGGGQFYGTTGGTTLNKAFHSIVIQSFQQLLRDPMTLLSSGKMLVTPYYSKYSLTGAGYIDTGLTYASSSAWRYASKLTHVDKFGSVHQDDNLGTTTTGCCDGQYYNASGVRVGRRLGSADSGLPDGPGYLGLNNEASFADWACGVGVLLCPSAGYSPE